MTFVITPPAVSDSMNGVTSESESFVWIDGSVPIEKCLNHLLHDVTNNSDVVRIAFVDASGGSGKMHSRSKRDRFVAVAVAPLRPGVAGGEPCSHLLMFCTHPPSTLDNPSRSLSSVNPSRCS